MKRIIFVNRYFYPDQSATSQMLSDLAFYLGRNGAEVTVVASRQLYDDPNAVLSPEEVWSNVRIRRVWSSTFGRQRLMTRAIDYLSFCLSAALWLFANLSRDCCIVAKTDPPLISVITALIARLHGAVHFTWLQDLFPEVATALNVRLAGNAEFALRHLRNLSLRTSRTNVVIGEKMYEKLLSQGISPGRIAVVHNWSDGDIIRPIPPEQNALRLEWGLKDKFVIGYSGNMGRGHDFGTIFEAARQLNCDPRIVFLLIGNGAQKDDMIALSAKYGLTNIVFKPFQPRELLPQSLTAPDVHLVSLLQELEGLMVPSKFYGIAAAGRTTVFIGDPNGEIGSILRSESCGIAVNRGDSDVLAWALKRLSQDSEVVCRMGRNAHSVFERAFDKKLALLAWKAILGVE
jgi:glycosyltransferase involved in cell wall biosynthesis